MIKRILQLNLVLFVILLWGCHTNYNDQTAPFAESHRYTKEDHLISKGQRIAMGKKLAKEWWSLFEYESLNRTMQQAMQHNYTIAAAKRTLAQAEESVKSVSGGLWPQIALLAAAGRQKYGVALFGPSTIKIPPFTYYEIGPSVSWTIDLFGSIRHSIEQKKALMQYQVHNLDATYITLTSNVAMQALEIASVNEEIAATKRIIAEDEKTLQLTQSAFEAGMRTRLDILNAQSQLETDRALLPALQQRLSVAKHALAILVGKAPADWSPPDFDLNNFVLPHELPVSLPTELVRKRPDILAAEANVHAACQGIGVATANLYPSLVLSANTMQEALTPHELFSAASNAWAYAANLAAPIFQGGTLRAEKRKAVQAYYETLEQYKQTILVAFQQVADALTALARDAEAIALERKTMEIAATTLQLSYESFQAGTIGLLQIQDDVRTLARAQINLIHAQTQRYQNTIQLFVALGGSPNHM